MRHKKTDLHDIAVRRKPINKLASMVTSVGVRYDPKKKICQRHWKNLPPIRRTPRNVYDLKGVRFGKFTVVGLYADTSKLSWVVRCVCGDYETRTQKAIKNLANKNDCCDYCRQLIHLKRHDEYKQHGYNKES